VGVIVELDEGETVAVIVRVAVSVALDDGEAVIVMVLVNVGVAVVLAVLVTVGVAVSVEAGLAEGVAVTVAVEVMVLVAVKEGVGVRVKVMVDVNEAIGVIVGVAVTVGAHGKIPVYTAFEKTGGGASSESMPAVFVITAPHAPETVPHQYTASVPAQVLPTDQFTTLLAFLLHEVPPAQPPYVIPAGTESNIRGFVEADKLNILRLSYICGPSLD